MFKILKKKTLNEQTKLMVVEAKRVAKRALPGQFTMLRIDEDGERIPLTIADYDREKGTITIIFQEVGNTTKKLGQMNEGDYIRDFVGPLGVASHLEGVKKACVIGGGLGAAIAYPQAKALSQMGAEVDSVLGFRNSDLIILEDEISAVSRNTYIVTDDGSNQNKGFVTDVLAKLIEGGEEYDIVIAIGPLAMMRAVAELTRPHGIKTIVSMNTIMIDGTGMCGGCRVIVGGETKFACVDGPDFDGHLVDFEVAMRRSSMYREKEKDHSCRIGLEKGE